MPDGYTLLLTSGTLAANVTLYRDLSFHPAKDLAPVAMLVQAPYIFAVQRPTPRWWAFVRGEMERSAAYPKGRKRLVKLMGITAD